MPAYLVNNGTFHWSSPTGGGTFRPNGPLVEVGESAKLRHNPGTWRTQKTLAARILVGFKVGRRNVYTMNDLMKIVTRVRTEQVGNPSASYIAQKGVYQHRSGKGVVTEDGAQVLIINLRKNTIRGFEKEMVELSEAIAKEMQQEEVILEVQENGISKFTMGIGP